MVWSVKCCKTAVNFGQLKLVFCRKLYPLNQTKASQGHKHNDRDIFDPDSEDREAFDPYHESFQNSFENEIYLNYSSSLPTKSLNGENEDHNPTTTTVEPSFDEESKSSTQSPPVITSRYDNVDDPEQLRSMPIIDPKDLIEVTFLMFQ